ncbi:MAG TPA: hypothetical protein VFN44_04640 [Solirubrobacteraceae bacterium]|nr:hypothetical protein [Solirubrobacteraceae bacterium]
MPRDVRALLLIALRASGGRGPHAEAARNVVLTIVLAQMLADAGHDGPPHPSWRTPRRVAPRRSWLARRESVTGRRPRG